MPIWLQITLLWGAFAGSHMLLSHGAIRSCLLAKLGANGFMGVYSLLAMAVFVPLVWVYLDNKHQGVLLWNLVALPGVKPLAMLLALVGIAVFVSGYFQMPPNGFVPLKDKSARGLTRITRHPMFMFLGLWGLSHCLLWGYASDVAFFGGFAVFALLGCAHQDSRKRQQADLQHYYAETSFLPFGAILSGRNRLVLGELPWLGLVVGVIFAIGFYHAHGKLFA